MPDTFPAAPVTALLGADGFPKSDWTPPDTGVQLAPGGAAAAQAGGYAPAQSKPAAVPVAAAPRAVQYLSGRPRSAVFDLAEPVAVNGVEIRQVVIRKLSTGDVASFVNAMRRATDDSVVRYPVFCHVGGALLTDDEWNALDAEDTDMLSEQCKPFLPPRLRK